MAIVLGHLAPRVELERLDRDPAVSTPAATISHSTSNLRLSRLAIVIGQRDQFVTVIVAHVNL
ncbi:hypothetical protein [Mycobacterium haemophilum]|uniref:Uncharacterized protein n=1 Tax=Mycobacterium haemophilum TaxID=29311 RepID=A0A0I9U9Q5_9MYCO|nr:hypothetical protein [Mycobacterium haemophilum]KLO33396.1 hypothetical protein ABH39_00590 [Mycobacterium haemophilum]KLO38919.1 hypothetical protein ABH38_00590 [Mycobacterium haemophilum]KLO45337.1 hypothetical protein ABH37_00590 [Mycobacterium haemophilum]KLO56486.1 hypothetical protein ABH36_00590 [Mycobacterium haemophilum]